MGNPHTQSDKLHFYRYTEKYLLNIILLAHFYTYLFIFLTRGYERDNAFGIERTFLSLCGIFRNI